MTISTPLNEACIRQERMAQKQLYQLLLPYLRAIATRYLRDNSYLKDALQESFVKIFKSISKYDPNQAPIKQWSARITINTCLNYNKRVIDTPEEELVIDKHESSIAPIIINDWDDESLLLILKKMPENYAEVFNLSIIDGYTHEEIAEMLNIGEALSRKRLSRARAWLKKIFVEKPNWLAEIGWSSFIQN